MKKLALLLAFLPAFASAQISRPTQAPGGGGTSTLTAGTTVTSGCTDGGFLYSLTNLLRCGANAINDGSVITLGGVAGSGENVVITNGTSTRSILILKDNTTTILTAEDGGIIRIPSMQILDAGGGGISTSQGAGTLWLSDGDNHNRFFMPYTASSSTINNSFRLEGHRHANTSTGYGTGLLFQGRSTTTADNDMIRVAGVWTDATHASRSAAVVFEAVNNAAALAEVGRFNAVGGLKIATGTKPTCDATYRGTLYYVAGGAGVADTYEACRKDAGDSYAWVSIY